MAKTPKITLENLDERIAKLEKLVKDGGVVQVEFPSASQIPKLPDDEVKEFCNKLGIKTEGKKIKALKALLVTVAKIGESEKVGEEEANALSKALSIKPGKNLKATIAAINDFINSGNEEEEEEEDDDDDDDDDDEEEAPKKGKKSKKSDDEDEDEEEEDDSDSDDDSDDDDDDSEDDDEEEEKPKKKKSKKDDEEEDEEDEDSDDADDDDSDSDDDDEEEEKPAKKKKGKKDDDEEDEEDEEEEEEEEEDDEEEETPEVDAAKVVKKVKKLPKEAVMKKQLAAFAKADPKAAKKLKGDDTEEKYRSLLERLVNDDGTIAEWGEPYVKGGEGYCCGLPLAETKKKGHKGDLGKCLVTGKLFSYNDDGEFEEVE